MQQADLIPLLAHLATEAAAMVAVQGIVVRFHLKAIIVPVDAVEAAAAVVEAFR
jgi:hypothetical protein